MGNPGRVSESPQSGVVDSDRLRTVRIARLARDKVIVSDKAASSGVCKLDSGKVRLVFELTSHFVSHTRL